MSGTNELKVKDQYRTNPLSLTPGGSQVKIVHENGRSFIYDKVKNPINYIAYISRTENANGKITEILIEGRSVWKDGKNLTPDWNITI
jgi:hypothetical protein